MGFKVGTDHKITNILERISSKDRLVSAYYTIKFKTGSMIPGSDNKTLDGIRMDMVSHISSEIRRGRFMFKPARRVIIPKKRGGERPLSIPSPLDKIVHQRIKQQLEMVFEPKFLDTSHGFRPKRGCHRAFNDVKLHFGNVAWMIEGDISDCFPSIQVDVLLPLLCQEVGDKGFNDLIRKFFKAGYMVDGYKQLSEGILQGRPLRPLLMNIVLHELDVFIDQIIKGYSLVYKTPRHNPLYTRLIRREGKRLEQIRQDRMTVVNQRIRSRGYNETNTIVRYVRYADDFIIGVAGNKATAEDIKGSTQSFLRKRLGIVMSRDKTKITHLIKDKAFFLGVYIHRTSPMKLPYKEGRIRRTRIVITAPIAMILNKLMGQSIGKKTSDGG